MYRNFPVFFHAINVCHGWPEVNSSVAAVTLLSSHKRLLLIHAKLDRGILWLHQVFWGQFNSGDVCSSHVALRLFVYELIFKNVSLLFLPGTHAKMVSPPLAVWNIATVLMRGPRQWLVLTWRRAGGGPQGLRGQTRGLRPLLPQRVKCPPEGLQT